MKFNKIIAPIIISAIIITYYVIYFVFLMTLIDGVLKYLLGIIPLVFAVVMIKVCVDRIREIKKGEEDDLSKY